MKKNLTRAFLFAAVAGIGVHVTHAANIVYVSPTATAPLYTDLSNGSGGTQAGTELDPFGSIQAAYHFLWNKGGAHEIRLLPGTFTGAHIGYDNNNAYTDMIFLDAAKLSGNPAWSSVKLTANAVSDTVTIDRNYPTLDIGSADPTAYEYLANRGDRAGLFRLPTGSPAFVGMIFEDITIQLGGGTTLVGSTGTGVQEWTFNNVDIFMEANYTITGYPGGDPPRRSALFSHHDMSVDMPGSFFDFNNSRIYVDPTGDIGSGYPDGMFVGYRWFVDDPFPDGFFDGNSTSWIYEWTTGNAVTGLEPLYTGDIWSSKRNSSVYIQHTDTGGVESGGFFVGFNIIPEPTSLVLLGLAGAALGMRRRRG